MSDLLPLEEPGGKRLKLVCVGIDAPSVGLPVEFGETGKYTRCVTDDRTKGRKFGEPA